MRISSIFLILFWIIIIKFPEFLAYLIGWFFVFLWLNMLIVWIIFNLKMKKTKDEWFVKFWKYKIYR